MASSSLFKKQNGDPMLFYMPPVPARSKVKKLIEQHGGQMLKSVDHGLGSAIQIISPQDSHKAPM